MSTQDLAQQVADLTTATTKLTQEVVGQKDRLTAAADTATGKSGAAAGSAQAAAQSVTDAAAEVTKATNQANTAEAEADRAKSEADRATQVTGLDTVEQAVDHALAETAGLMTESEARAIHKQNELRFPASGMVAMGRSFNASTYSLINEGMFVRNDNPNYSNQVYIGVSDTNAIGKSKSGHAITHIAGAVANVLNIDNKDKTWVDSAFNLPQAPGGTDTYNKATGESIKHPDVATAFALAATSDDIEVVTHPVDLVMLEYFEEELIGRQEVMECIQSLSTTFGDTDVPTVLSTRPLSYFQQYDGQFPDPTLQNDRYRCVVWSDLTTEQKRKVAAYMGEKLFMGENGFPVNGRLRARTIRGAGNGDWDNIDSTITNLKYDSNRSIIPRGVSNSTDDDASAGSSSRYVNDGIANSKGVFSTATIKDAFAYKGRCFAYVVATVPRANKGAYHPNLNPWGCGRGVNVAQNGYVLWYLSNAKKPTSQKDCFTAFTSGTGIAHPTLYTGSITAGVSLNGHPDGIFYDGIEADGLNGVIDWRLGAVANDSPEEAAKVEAKVENGTYRGLERLVVTKVGTVTVPNGSIWSGGYTKLIASGQTWDISGWAGKDQKDFGHSTSSNSKDLEGCYIIGNTGEVHPLGSFDIKDTGVCYVSGTSGNVASQFPAGTYHVVIMSLVGDNLSVSGEFNTKMVIGDPANILQTDALKDGWLGTWCPAIPEGVSKEAVCSRKNIGSGSLGRQITYDNGVTWVSNVISFDYIKNSNTGNHPLNSIQIWNYKAFAKQTKPSTNKPVYNSKAGLMDVFAHNGTYLTNYGSLLLESLIGKVGVSSQGSGYFAYTAAVNDFGFVSGGEMYRTAPPTHSQLILRETNNNSPAFKVLPYQISNNGQGSIGYQANELTYDADATNWGDDSTIKVTADGSDTFVDLNGNTNLSVVHELAIPYTWTSNHARAGEQIEGVDL